MRFGLVVIIHLVFCANHNFNIRQHQLCIVEILLKLYNMKYVL